VHIDTLITNAGETEAIFKQPVPSLRSHVGLWRRALARKGIGCLIITRGSRATLCLTPDECFETAALRVKPVDTVGAGDAFAGTFAARLASGENLAAAIGLANCAGALATLKPGAQESIPDRRSTDRATRALHPS